MHSFSSILIFGNFLIAYIFANNVDINDITAYDFYYNYYATPLSTPLQFTSLPTPSYNPANAITQHPNFRSSNSIRPTSFRSLNRPTSIDSRNHLIKDKIRLVGFYESGKDNTKATKLTCSIISHYTHINYIVTLKRNNNNRQECYIDTDTINAEYITMFKSCNVNVILSVGYNSNSNGVQQWEYCNQDNLYSQVITILNRYSFHGIDLNYNLYLIHNKEYFINLSNQLSNYMLQQQSQQPSKSLLLVHSTLLMQNQLLNFNSFNSKSIDFIIILNVNYFTFSNNLIIFDNLLHTYYLNNPKNVVLGICINECNEDNMSVQQIHSFVGEFVAKYGPTFGGVALISLNSGDENGIISSDVRGVLAIDGKPVPP